MQDFNYLSTNCMEITLELGCVKFPEDSAYPKEWSDNEDALYAFMWQVCAAYNALSSFLFSCFNENISGIMVWYK